MKESKFQQNYILIPFLAILAIWMVYYIEIKFGLNFNKYGIYPKTFLGLRGVLYSPFIHSNATHLFNNSIPLGVMLGCLYYFYNKIATKVLLIGFILTGILTWIFARPAYHIGASGVVYFLVSFIFFSGVFRKYYRLIALSLAVVFLYGSMVWYIFPIEQKISWEGHLSGFLIGFIVAYIYKNKGPKPEQFIFTKNDEFDSLFDENGNYIPPLEEEVEENKTNE
ncbi:rhomboid family intramembrane serine protease [Lutibacter sp.]|uniref:rhomboid family intramembrane serine protease n=1 Tax=Lutibacter sp. TaxID=1925666 RepID=UPI0025BF5853|nr:rhomboid family intramembrane serine protease [Lutibacter sp.]MCF6167563.1 rhomboid family intramembrane serine protease [Lutibacter sp.]